MRVEYKEEPGTSNPTGLTIQTETEGKAEARSRSRTLRTIQTLHPTLTRHYTHLYVGIPEQ